MELETEWSQDKSSGKRSEETNYMYESQWHKNQLWHMSYQLPLVYFNDAVKVEEEGKAITFFL